MEKFKGRYLRRLRISIIFYIMCNCLTPVQGWYCGFIVSKDGVYSPNLVFSFNEARDYYNKHYGECAIKFLERNSVSINCGKCFACRLRKRKEMTTRLSNELSLYGEDCCFITLTYNDESIPTTSLHSVKDPNKMVARGIGSLPVETLLPSDVQKFIKRLRRHLEYIPKSSKKRIGRDTVNHPIRYFAVGEYGSKTARPHYHLLIFGWSPSDLSCFSQRKGNIVYTSKQLQKLWTFGFSTVQPCGYGVSRYCARYVTKKFVNDSKERLEPFKDSYFPEFVLQSIKNGGIGAPWFDRHFEEVISRGYVNYKQGTNFLKASIPTYYLRRLRKNHLCAWLQLREEKIRFLKSKPKDTYQDFEDLQRKCLCESYKLQEQYSADLF